MAIMNEAVSNLSSRYSTLTTIQDTSEELNANAKCNSRSQDQTSQGSRGQRVGMMGKVCEQIPR